MISCFDIGNSAFDTFGDVVLTPTTCTITEDAGGSYELVLSHPFDVSERWKHMVPGAIIKAPVPVGTTPNASIGQDADVYKTLGSYPLREEPSEPTTVTYQSWVSGNIYSVGDKVSYNYKNWQCIAFDQGSGEIFVPPGNGTWWTEIARTTGGAAVLTTLPPNTEVYLLDRYSDTWLHVTTKYGVSGYMKADQLQYVRHEQVEPVPERVVTDQLFRIYNVDVNTAGKQVNINARHVSYDLAAIIVRDCEFSLVSPPMAIMRIVDSLMMPYQGQIATNLTSKRNGTISGSLSGKNGIFAFLDPDKGIVPYFRARLFRDNWDMFIMRNDITDRGIVLAYGKNLKGVNWKRKSDGIVTRVVPVARNANGDDLYLPGNSPWVDSENIRAYPVVTMERLKVDGQVGGKKGDSTTEQAETWTEEELLQEMRNKASERFTVDHADAVSVEITVDFLLLGHTEEYKQYKGLDKLYLYDQITVKDPTVGLDLKLQISSIEWDCINQRYNSIKIGNIFDYGGRTVASYDIGDGAIDYEKISNSAIQKIIGGVR